MQKSMLIERFRSNSIYCNFGAAQQIEADHVYRIVRATIEH